MKITKFIFLLFFLCVLTPKKIYPFINPEKHKQDKKNKINYAVKNSSDTIKNKQSYINSIARWKDFKKQYGSNWKMQFNPHTEVIDNIWGYKTKSRAGKPEDAAKDFISANKEMFKIKSGDLDLKKIRKHKNYQHVKYSQTYKGIPVEKSKVLVHLLEDNSVIGLRSTFFPDIELGIIPQLTEGKALEIVKNDLKPETVPLKTPQVTLSIFPKEEEKKYFLSWKIRIRTNKPLGDWIYFVDATTGDILLKYNNLRFGNISGYILPFDGDDSLALKPFANEYVTVNSVKEATLINGDYSGADGDTISSQLEGPYAKVYNDDQAEVLISTNVAGFTWNYSKASSEIDEVNAFYHVNAMHDFFTKMSSTFIGVNYQMEVWVHNGFSGSMEDINAYYDPSDGNIYFGDGDLSYGLKNFAQESDIIYHEYTHAVVGSIYELLYLGQSGALDEAFADYFAASYTEDNFIGEWALPYADQRNLNNSNKYPNDWYGEVHKDSLIYSGALWDFRAEVSVSSTTANEIIFDALFFEPDNFKTGMQAILLADDHPDYGGDNDLSNGTPHKIEIETAFLKHGITLDDMDEPVEAVNDTYEPNNAFSESYDLQPDRQCSSYISYAGDADYYRVSAGPGKMSIKLDFPFYRNDEYLGNIYSPCDIYLYNSLHQLIAYRENTNIYIDWAVGQYVTTNASFEITYTNNKPDFYYVLVLGSLNSYTKYKPYKLTASFISGGASISAIDNRTIAVSGIAEIGSKSIEDIRVKDQNGNILTRGIDVSNVILDGDLGTFVGTIDLGDIQNNYPSLGTIHIELALKNKWDNIYLIGPSNYLKTLTSSNKLTLWNNILKPKENKPATIKYEILNAGHVSIKIYNIAGELIKVLVDGEELSGAASVEWDGRNKYGEPVSSGLYLVHLDAPGFKKTRKIVVVK